MAWFATTESRLLYVNTSVNKVVTFRVSYHYGSHFARFSTISPTQLRKDIATAGIIMVR